jgi:hypothetical protein
MMISIASRGVFLELPGEQVHQDLWVLYTALAGRAGRHCCDV